LQSPESTENHTEEIIEENSAEVFDVNNHKLMSCKSVQSSPIPKEKWEPGQFYCNKCPRKFSRSHDLKRHFAMCGGKPCDYPNCTKKFLCVTALREHVAAIHTREYLYRCGKCSKGFFYRSAISKHKKMSTCC